MRIDHDTVARRRGPRDWIVRCFTCDFVEEVDERRDALALRRRHIEDNTAPPGQEPELGGGHWLGGCDLCGADDHHADACLRLSRMAVQR